MFRAWLVHSSRIHITLERFFVVAMSSSRQEVVVVVKDTEYSASGWDQTGLDGLWTITHCSGSTDDYRPNVCLYSLYDCLT
jgi:hypothetical protein